MEWMSGFFSEYNGFSWENYGTKWVNEHRIPMIAYDHTDYEDVKRCWSAHNMHPMDPIENMEKADKLIDDEIGKVPRDFWPKAWGGMFPDKEKKEKLYSEWKERRKNANELANSESSRSSCSTDPVGQEEEEYEDSEPEEDEYEFESSDEEDDDSEEGSGFESD